MATFNTSGSEPSRWGQSCSQPNDLPLHVTVVESEVPEGLLFTASCQECGGRHETLADFRRTGDPSESPDDDAFRTDTADLPYNHVCSWADEHAGCAATGRRLAALTPEVKGTLLTGLDQMDRAPGNGGQRRATLVLWLNDGSAIGVSDLRAAQPTSVDHSAYALRSFMLRDLVRAAGRRVEVALYTTEVFASPAPGAEPARCAAAVVATPDASFIAMVLPAGMRKRGPRIARIGLDAGTLPAMAGLFAARDLAPHPLTAPRHRGSAPGWFTAWMRGDVVR